MQLVSVVIPAKNEAQSLAGVLEKLAEHVPLAEVIVVDDGSSDETGMIAREHGATVVRHRRSLGNGAAVKSGVRSASGDIVVCMDADGQHDPADVPRLLEEMDSGMDMAVAARAASAHAGWWRRFANGIYNGLASLIVGHRVYDLTSGFRAVRGECFRQFLYLLPNGFSYPTTITMAFFRAGYQVAYVPVNVQRRAKGSNSHIRLFRDGSRFFIIIFKMATLYSPMKVFLPVSLVLFLGGIGYYFHTYMTDGSFTNFGALLMTTAVVTFLIGLVSEQISALIYRPEPD